MKQAELLALVAAVALAVGGVVGYRVGAAGGSAPAAPVVAAADPEDAPPRGDLVSQPVSADGRAWVQVTLLGASSEDFDMRASDQNQVEIAGRGVFRGVRVRTVAVDAAMEKREHCQREQGNGLTLLDCAGEPRP